ncbi:hypothetical protein Pmani_003118 [Petrolisthes manimaculis]|uniref:Uncharacterized protein n=1 Tax=Petrolisthes manimaculis TaxID=1843537 RepID=A0AAE1QJL9_9EUCA|nr:hypothetical protein Pmani_003118 [Petrolisthes manimaculis]
MEAEEKMVDRRQGGRWEKIVPSASQQRPLRPQKNTAPSGPRPIKPNQTIPTPPASPTACPPQQEPQPTPHSKPPTASPQQAPQPAPNKAPSPPRPESLSKVQITE